MTPLDRLHSDIVRCNRCPRLRDHCTHIAAIRRRAYRDQVYWGKPVPGFGDPKARLLILGLAPGAHGANRTGRMFTGDRSGDFLYKVLYDAGFASQPAAVSAGDGLSLHDCYISASARCAPPDNKPTPEELRNCRPFFERELKLLNEVRVIVCLGRIAFDTYLSVLGEPRAAHPFGHDAEHRLSSGPPVITSYHPSQQNTQTGRLTEAMLQAVFARARRLIEI